MMEFIEFKVGNSYRIYDGEKVIKIHVVALFEGGLWVVYKTWVEHHRWFYLTAVSGSLSCDVAKAKQLSDERHNR